MNGGESLYGHKDMKTCGHNKWYRMSRRWWSHVSSAWISLNNAGLNGQEPKAFKFNFVLRWFRIIKLAFSSKRPNCIPLASKLIKMLLYPKRVIKFWTFGREYYPAEHSATSVVVTWVSGLNSIYLFYVGIKVVNETDIVWIWILPGLLMSEGDPPTVFLMDFGVMHAVKNRFVAKLGSSNIFSSKWLPVGKLSNLPSNFKLTLLSFCLGSLTIDR